MAADYPDQVAGLVYGLAVVARRLRQVGCELTADGEAAGPGSAAAPSAGHSKHERHDHGRHDRAEQWLTVIPPSWRPDLTDPSDLAEEVIRLEGYENIPVRMPRAPAGHGLTPRQQMRRTIGRALAGAGYVEVISNPFLAPPTPTGCSSRPTTRGAACPGWSTRSRRTSRCCGARCCPGCCGCSAATSAADSPMSRCSSSARSS